MSQYVTTMEFGVGLWMDRQGVNHGRVRHISYKHFFFGFGIGFIAGYYRSGS